MIKSLFLGLLIFGTVHLSLPAQANRIDMQVKGSDLLSVFRKSFLQSEESLLDTPISNECFVQGHGFQVFKFGANLAETKKIYSGLAVLGEEPIIQIMGLFGIKNKKILGNVHGMNVADIFAVVITANGSARQITINDSIYSSQDGVAILWADQENGRLTKLSYQQYECVF